MHTVTSSDTAYNGLTVLRPELVIERISTAMSETLEAHRTRFDADLLLQIRREWDAGRQSVERVP